MNSRKFYLLICSIISVFLFICGISLLIYLNNSAGISANSNNPLDNFLNQLKGLKTGPVNILVLGGDKVNRNTDTILLVNFDPASAKLNIMSIPRDTKVKVKGSSIPKINSAFPIGGAERAVETVSSLLNVKINYYVFVDTTSVAKIIDKLDGVDFDIPANMNYEDPDQNLYIHLKKGFQHLNGSQVVQFMRFRKANNWTGDISKYYDGSDVKRIEAQQEMIKEIISQKINIKYLTRINDILNIVFKNVETNLTLNEALKFSQNLSKLSLNNVNMLILPGNAVEEDYSYFIIDKPKTNEIIKQYFSSSSVTNGISNNKNQETKNVQTEKPVSTPKKSTSGTNSNSESKPDVAKNNPSNSDTSIQGSKEPGP